MSSVTSPPAPEEPRLRLALLGSGTLEPLGIRLQQTCAEAGLNAMIHTGGFGRWAEDLLDPHSPVYDLDPEVIALCVDTEALFPRLLSEPFLSEADRAAEAKAGLEILFRALDSAARHAPQATILLHTFPVPDHAPLGILDAMTEGGQRASIASLNQAIADRVHAQLPSVFLLDQERIEARYGKAKVRDPRCWYLASVPFSDGFQTTLAAEYLRILRPLKGLTRKCIVLDLDNTLWGGVIGEDGFDGIRLGGTTAPGNAFHAFQRVLDALRQRGILLAVCSKNHEADAMDVLERHPGMALRPDAFAAMRINWESKDANIVSLSRELNLGLNSFVFMDDNPAERALIRERLPEVLTVEMPRDPALYPTTLLALDVFESMALTDEDRRRSDQYAAQRRRRLFEEGLSVAAKGEPGPDASADLTAHLTGLNIEVRLSPATPFTIPRIAQLINKTNQFNVTTRRYSETEVRAMTVESERFSIFSASVSDRFGDSGLTGVAIVRKEPDVWEIDSFLLSCRVLGRGIEQALLAYVARQATRAGAKVLRGVFLPTDKNAPAARFYAEAGFRPTTDESWEICLTEGGVMPSICQYPHWLYIREREETPKL